MAGVDAGLDCACVKASKLERPSLSVSRWNSAPSKRMLPILSCLSSSGITETSIPTLSTLNRFGLAKPCGFFSSVLPNSKPIDGKNCQPISPSITKSKPVCFLACSTIKDLNWLGLTNNTKASSAPTISTTKPRREINSFFICFSLLDEKKKVALKVPLLL